MTIILVLGVHLLLLSIYMYMIQTGKSRLSMSFLLLAVGFPFVGELCLLVAEFGKVPDEPSSRKRFITAGQKKRITADWECPDDWEKIIMSEENISRRFLMNVIDCNDDILQAKLLKSALHSPSSEVCHIAASGLMKLGQKYENAISAARNAYKSAPNNVMLLNSYIDTVRRYIASGVPDNAAEEELKVTEEKLICKYHQIIPGDENMSLQAEQLAGLEEKE